MFLDHISWLGIKYIYAQCCARVTVLQTNLYKVIHISWGCACSSSTAQLVAHGGSSCIIDLSLVFLEPNYTLQWTSLLLPIQF